MNLFKSKNFKIKPVTPTIRTVRVPEANKPSPLPSRVASSNSAQVQRSEASPLRASSTPRSSPATPNSDGQGSSQLKSGKRKTSRQKSPTRQVYDNDSEDDGTTEEVQDTAYKRQKRNRAIDSKRQLRSKQAFSEADGGVFEMIHAADIASVSKKSKLAVTAPAVIVTVELQYPSASQRERYNLVFGIDNINPTKEIIEIAQIVADVYLTEEQQKVFYDADSGLSFRQLEKANNLLSKDITDKKLLEGFKKAVDKYNSTIEGLLKDGALAANLDAMHHLPLRMVGCIIRQIYDRAVSPKVELLKQYDNGTDNVYGELKPPFISQALAEAGLKSDQVFVDLGSGVGNVVLQAALEFGCESWGCEMMENACKLADAQQKEFAARCRLWGIETGQIRLERGDFLENCEILKTLKRADVILVNNQAFTPQLNQSLVDLFLELKDGCKIVSLKPFGDGGNQISSRQLYNPTNLFVVTKLEWFSGSVSWTDGGGSYYISRKDVKRLQAFAERE